MATILEVELLTKRFGGLYAVKNLSFKLSDGEILGIIGPNGAGKSTILNLISNIYPPNSGKVYYKGSNIVGYPSNKIAIMGIVRTFQSTVSYSESTVWENMVRAQLGFTFSGLLAEFVKTKIVREKKAAILNRTEELLTFLNLEKMADCKACTMSYGQQKLLGLAIALAGEPSLLMLDEPAAGLNTDESLRLMNILRKISETGKSIILVEHDMKMVMGLSHNLLVLNYGQRIAFGTPAVIQMDAEVIKAYLGDEHDFT
jgi:branched-chain amino acid transport system ATP-binding protein